MSNTDGKCRICGEGHHELKKPNGIDVNHSSYKSFLDSLPNQEEAKKILSSPRELGAPSDDILEDPLQKHQKIENSVENLFKVINRLKHFRGGLENEEFEKEDNRVDSTEAPASVLQVLTEAPDLIDKAAAMIDEEIGRLKTIFN